MMKQKSLQNGFLLIQTKAAFKINLPFAIFKTKRGSPVDNMNLIVLYVGLLSIKLFAVGILTGQ